MQEAFIDLSVLRSYNGRIYCRGPRVAGHVVAVNEAETELGLRATAARRAVRNRAKLVASIDQVSQGRFLFGVGGGWNQDEMEDHGTVYASRFKRMRESIEAMKEI